MDTILIRYSEIALKKGKRTYFEKLLLNNIRSKLENTKIIKEFGRIYLKKENFSVDDLERLKKIPGISSFSKVIMIEPEAEKIKEKWVEIIREKGFFNEPHTFKCDTKRVDKNFAFHSDEFSMILGKHIFQNFENCSTNYKNPDIHIYTEIRTDYAYLFTEKIICFGGLPVGTGGKGLSLLSGGLDSPVASFLMMKRGMKIDFVHFASPPYTSGQAKDKVIELARRTSQFENKARLYIVPLTDIQINIRKKTDERYMTILLRRIMLEISSKLAKKYKYNCLITGDSLGQVASQAIDALIVVEKKAEIPVLRPLISFNKEEVISISRDIGTYDISILPYDDCCTLFVPKHPETKPRFEKVLIEEEKWYESFLVEEALNKIELIEL